MRHNPEIIKEFLTRVKDKLRLKSLVIAISVVVIFTTTYLLILPAFTLDKDEAAEQGGIDVVAEETSAMEADTVDADTNEAVSVEVVDAKEDSVDVKAETADVKEEKAEASKNNNAESASKASKSEEDATLVETTLTDPKEPDVSISGMLPEGGSISVTSVEGDEFTELEAKVRKAVRKQDKTALFVADSAYDIEIYDEQGNLFEPEDHDQTVTVSVEKDIADGVEMLVAHEAKNGGIEEPVTVEVEDGKIEYEAEHFSKVIDGTTYYDFSGITIKPATDTAYVGETFELDVEFTMEELGHANFYGEIPYDDKLIDYSTAKGTITLDGEPAGTYKVVVEDGKAYLCISLDPEHAQGSAGNGTFTMTAKALAEGEIHFDNDVVTIKDKDEEKYDNVSITKGIAEQGPVREGDYKDGFFATYKIVLKNNGNEDVSGLTVYDAPYYFNIRDLKAPYGFNTEDGRKVVNLQYGKTIPGDGNNYTMLPSDKNPYSTDPYLQDNYRVENVSIKAGQELVWTYTVYLSEEDAKILDEANKTAYWQNYAGFRSETGSGKEVSKMVTYEPDSDPLTKTGVIPAEDGDNMEWIIALETKGYHNAAGKYISDKLKESIEDLHFILDDSGDYQPYVYVYAYGNKIDTQYKLTWEKVDDALSLTEGDPLKIYYDDKGQFRWFSPFRDDTNYGFELHYWTNFNKEWLSEDGINQAASNYSDLPDGEGWIPGEYETNISLTKRLDKYDANNHTADWTIEMPISLTDTAQAYIKDLLPDTLAWPEQDHLRDTMDVMDNVTKGESTGGKLIFVNDDIVGENSSGQHMTVCQRYYEFDTVAEFEAFTGIKVSTEGKSADEILRSSGKLGFYLATFMDDDGKPLGGHWIIYPNANISEDSGITGSYEELDVENLDSSLPAGNYTIRLDYRTDTAISTEVADDYTNTTYLIGTTSLGNSFELIAYANYYMAPDDVKSRVEKNIANVVRDKDGKLQITYMALVDNRSDSNTISTLRYTDTYRDYLTGLPEGSAKLLTDDEHNIKVYKVPVTYDNSDPTGWSMTRADSLDDLTSDKGFVEITEPLGDDNDPYGGIERSISDDGDNFKLEINNLKNMIDAAAMYRQEKGIKPEKDVFKVINNTFDSVNGLKDFNWDDLNETDCSNITKASYYIVYTVEVDEHDLNQADVLRNTINTYGGPNGNPTGSAYVDYAVLLDELRKTITEKPTSGNGYMVSYQLDVNMTDTLSKLDAFTITDKLGDNLELDVQSLQVYRVNKDGTETPISSSESSGEHYTSMYTDNNLVISMNRGDASWASQYVVRYKASLTDYEGRVQYENEARIPEGTNVPHSTEGEVYIRRPEGEVTNLKVDIYKYDGNNTSQALPGAKFKMFNLSEAKREELKALIDTAGTTQDDVDAFFAGLSDSDWVLFDSEKTTGADGRAVFSTYKGSDGEYHSILFNEIYKLQETSAPAGYSSVQLKTQYFMFYTTKYPSYKNVEGVQNYVRTFVPEIATFLVPNYKTSFTVYKTDAEDTDKKLTGVTFGLFTDPECKKIIDIKDYAYPYGQQVADGVYYPDIPVPSEGTRQYYLKELQAPETYLLDPNRVFVVNVTSKGELSFEEKVLENGKLRDLTDDETASLIDKSSIGLTISNKPNLRDFDFNKEWLIGGNTEEWPEDVEEITVTLTRTCGKNTQDVTFTVTANMTDSIDLSKIEGSQIDGIVTQTSAKDKVYSYKITGLEDVAFGSTSDSNGEKWDYTISEVQVDGFNSPKYVKKGETEPTGGATSVDDGGTILNDRITAVLPNTGGIGTTMFHVLGLMLIFGAGVIYAARKLTRANRNQ